MPERSIHVVSLLLRRPRPLEVFRRLATLLRPDCSSPSDLLEASIDSHVKTLSAGEEITQPYLLHQEEGYQKTDEGYA